MRQIRVDPATTRTRHPRRMLVVATAFLAVLLGGGAASGWSVPGAGAGAVASDSLVAPVVTATRSATAPSSRIDVTWTAAGQLSGATYEVTRTSGSTTTTLAGCTASPCSDTGLVAGTTFTYTVTAKLGGWTRSGTAAQSTQAIASLTSFALAVPGSPQAGVAHSVTVTARDQQGATFADYTGVKTLTWTGSATAISATGSAASFGTATFSNGIATVSVNLKRAGSGLGLTVTDGSITGTTNVNVSANSPSRLGFTTVSSGGAQVTNCLLGCTLTGRGGNGDITTKVSVLDSFGNVTTTAGQINVTVSKTGGTFTPDPPPSIVIAQGGSESANAVKLSDNGNWTSQTLTAQATGLASIQATISKN